MSKLSHSNPALDNVLATPDPENDEELSISEMMTEGCICTICMHPFAEIYGYSKACEECGGDGVQEAIQEIIANCEYLTPAQRVEASRNLYLAYHLGICDGHESALKIIRKHTGGTVL